MNGSGPRRVRAHASSCCSGRAVLIPFLLTSVGRDHWPRIFSGCWTPCAKWSLSTSVVVSMAWHTQCKRLPQQNFTLHQLYFAELLQQTCCSPAQLSDEADRAWLQQPHLEAFRQSFITHQALHWFWMVTSYKKCDSAEPGIAERSPGLGEKPLLLLLCREKAELQGDCLDFLLSEPCAILRICQI